ncbi:hypothetical protein [Paenibacillus pinihumi]|uniref:hypothetical protein n=1 Tax=Paenibacillus pinihumi TaxID=669462 RepID=UPI00040A964D|nr:hypothetical protein [Paenibacillus pinihumi]
MPVQIHISGENAEQAIQEFSVLSAAFVGTVAPAATPDVSAKSIPVVTEKPKQKRQTAKVENEPEVKPEVKPEPEQVEEPDLQEEDASEDPEDIPSSVDLRAKAQEVSKADPANRAKVKELLDNFGCKNITEVPENKRVQFMAELEKLA